MTTQPARPRPGVVTLSSYLLMLYAALQAVTAVLALSTIGTIRDVYQDVFAGTSAEGAEDVVVVLGAGSAIVQLIFAAGFVVLAVLNNRGKNASRVTTWVVGSVAVCCVGAVLAGGALSGSLGAGVGADVSSQEDVARRLEEALPSWYGPIDTVLNVLGLLALLTALVLLALPASNQFFRKQQPAWESPVPGAYPGYPSSGTPGHPGQTLSGEPGYPPAPGYSPPSGTGQSEQPPAGGSGGPDGDQNPPGDRPPSAS